MRRAINLQQEAGLQEEVLREAELCKDQGGEEQSRVRQEAEGLREEGRLVASDIKDNIWVCVVKE